MCNDASEREAEESGDPMGWVKPPKECLRQITTLIDDGMIEESGDGFVCPTREGRVKGRALSQPERVH